MNNKTNHKNSVDLTWFLSSQNECPLQWTKSVNRLRKTICKLVNVVSNYRKNLFQTLGSYLLTKNYGLKFWPAMFLEVPVKKRLALKPENRCFQPDKFEPIFQTSTSEPNLLDYITIIFSLSFGNSFKVASIGRYVMHFPLNYDVGTYLLCSWPNQFSLVEGSSDDMPYAVSMGKL